MNKSKVGFFAVAIAIMFAVSGIIVCSSDDSAAAKGVVSYGGANYETINAAIAAFEADAKLEEGTITLLDDVSYEPDYDAGGVSHVIKTMKKLTIDGGDNTITIVESKDDLKGIPVSVIGDVTISNATIDSELTGGQLFFVGKDQKLTLDRVTLSDGAGNINLDENECGGILTVKASTLGNAEIIAYGNGEDVFPTIDIQSTTGVNLNIVDSVFTLGNNLKADANSSFGTITFYTSSTLTVPKDAVLKVTTITVYGEVDPSIIVNEGASVECENVNGVIIQDQNPDADSNVAKVVLSDITNYFNTLADAVAYVNASGEDYTIILLKDVNVDSNLTLENGSININSHIITIADGCTLAANIISGEDNDADVALTAGENGARISQGSIVISGDYSGSEGTGITINSGEVKIYGTLDNSLAISIGDGAKLVIPEGKTLSAGQNALTITGDEHAVTKSVVTVYGGITGENVSIDVNTKVAVSPSANIDPSDVAGEIESVYAESGDKTGYKGTIDGNTEINGQAFLSDSLTIAAGVTLTINGDLSLNGKNLIVKGNLVINNKGTITGVGSDTGDNISIVDKGTITNNGTIGKGNFPVTVSSGEQIVFLQGVDGVQISTNKNADLLISGNITKISGATLSGIAVAGAYLDGDVTIAKNVSLYIYNEAYISKNSTVIINGVLDTDDGALILKEGSGITVNGKAFGTIVAEVADSIPAATASTFDDYDYSGILLDDSESSDYSATGYTLSVVRSQYSDASGDIFFKQTAYLSGNINTSKSNEGVTFVIGGMITIDQDTTVIIGKDVTVRTFDEDSYIIVNGTLVNAPEDIGYIGASYVITTVDTGVSVRYITSFDKAYSVIDTTNQKTITLSGLDGYEIELNGEYIIKANQIISLEESADELIIIGESGIITVEEDGTLDSNVIKKINGKLVVKDGASCDPDESLYDVMSKDENETITYAGFQVIINEAKAGDKITITGDNAKVSSATIPEGVTVTVEGKLTVEKSLTVAEGGKIIIDGGSVTIGTAADANVKAVPGTLKNSGTVDTTDGTLTMLGGTPEKKATIESTGKLVTIAAYDFGTNYALNGAKFIDEDNNTVITTVSKAVESSAAAGTNSVTVIGDVNDTTDIVLGKVTLTIDENAEATLGTIDVNGARIVSNGLLTATIKGQFGTDGSTSDAIFKTTKATITSITNTSNINAQNVKVWSLTFGAITGSVEFVKGTIVSGDISAPATSVIKKAVLKVDSDATLSIETDIDAITGFSTVIIDGNVIVTKDGDLDIDKATVNGKITVEGDVVIGKLTLKGTLEVIDDEDVTGTASVTGSLVLGEVATTGAEPVVVGYVSLGTGAYVLAYPGSTVTASNFGTADSVKTTTFYIDGVEYLTAYATTAVLAIGTDAPATGFMNDVKIDGHYTTGIDDATKWFSDVEMKKSYTSSKFYIGDKSALYFKTSPMSATIQVSVGTGISLYVDDLKVTGDKPLTIGTHTVKAIVDPGYKGDVTITFDGKTVTDGKIVINSDMINAGVVLAATGNITIDSGDVPTPTPVPTPSEKDDSMGITEYLLIVLVILAAILVVVVAIRMMRS